jgi:O-antigen/teichoic acid export membrane protein
VFAQRSGPAVARPIMDVVATEPPSPDQPPAASPARGPAEGVELSLPASASVGETAANRTAGERAVENTVYRSVGEIVGRLASLLLFAAMARKLGQDGLGAFVFAVAYLGFVMVAVDLGLDRYLLRAVVRERDPSNPIFFNVLALKLVLAVPLLALGLLGVHVLGYGEEAALTALALAPGVVADSVARTQSSFFLAHERGAPPSIADAIQRILSAALGLAALQAGYGVAAVAAAYSIGSMAGVLIGFLLLQRTIGLPVRAVRRAGWRSLAANSLPYAIQDTFSVLLARMDMLILSLIAVQAAVGRYGAAYRLFESTFLITYALSGSFSAMFTYLGAHTDPPLRVVFQQSLRLAVTILMPLGVAFLVLAPGICELVYGAHFGSAGLPLRLLAPAVLLMGFVNLSVALIVSQENARRVVLPAGVMVALNIVLNAILIPLYSDSGAAAAMLATEVAYAIWMLSMAYRAVGALNWRSIMLGALLAGLAMVGVTLLLQAHVLAALTAGTLTYLAALAIVEQAVNHIDVALALRMVRRRLRREVAG